LKLNRTYVPLRMCTEMSIWLTVAGFLPLVCVIIEERVVFYSPGVATGMDTKACGLLSARSLLYQLRPRQEIAIAMQQDSWTSLSA